MSCQNYISKNVVCDADSCAMASQCSRHQHYQEARKREMVLQVLNTSVLEFGDGGCEYLHIDKAVKVARGFKKMYASIPRGAAVNVWQRFPFHISRRQFYRLRNGELNILPEDQSAILAYFQLLGADTSLGFDKYEIVMM